MRRQVGCHIELVCPKSLPGRNLTISAGDSGSIIDVDDNGDLVIRLHRFYAELNNCQNLICLSAKESQISVRSVPPSLVLRASHA